MSGPDSALLIVDDNEDNRYTLTRRLGREGYGNITVANDGKAALALLGSQRFDLVLLDIMMPGLNGYQVLEQMKADLELRHVPVIMISAVDELESVIRCIELGAEDYLPKPFNPTLLRARVGASLEKKRLRDEVRASLHRLEQELDTARALQLGMLPTAFPEWSPAQPVHVHASMEPAREVGGDLYDFFYAGDNRFCFMVGDVSGKGAPAAMFMARTRGLVRMAVTLWQELASEAAAPCQIAEVVNRELRLDNRERMFVTLFLGFLDTRTGVLTYVNAGHPPPYLLRAEGFERVEGKPDVPLGVRREARYRDHTVSLRPGDGMFVCTDGVAEAMNGANEHYTVARLDADLGAALAASPAEIIGAVKARVAAFCGTGARADDVTMLALRWLPGDASRQCVELVIRNDLAELAQVSAALDRIGADYAIPSKALTQLQVALDEIVSNVIKYAWPEGGAHEIRIRVTPRSGEVKIEIVDDGRAFNPALAAPPGQQRPGEKPRPGGLGIHLVKQLVDAVDFARVGNRNHLTMVKRCAASAPSQ